MQRSLFCRHTRPSFPPIFASHTQRASRRELPAPSLANARSYGLACSLYGHVPPSSGWLACAYGLLRLVVASRHLTAPCLAQMAMTKDAFGGSRVIHGQNCPISAEISQKLDLYSDRPKSGRQASQSSTDGRRPRVFLPQILHVQSVPGFAHRSCWW